MTTALMITGTNCSGKTTLAKCLISLIGGGVARTESDRTVCNDPTLQLVGKYAEDIKHGGCDGLNATKPMEGIARRCFGDGASVVIAEGSYLDTFGLNLSNFLFAADRQLVIVLAAPLAHIRARLKARSGGEINLKIAEKQQRVLRAAKKWSEIGVPVLYFNTAETPTEKIAETIIRRIWNDS